MLTFYIRLLALALIFCLHNKLKSQANVAINSKTLTPKEVAELFNEHSPTKQTLKFPIYKVFQFNDSTGAQYAVLSEKPDSTNKTEEIINEKIQALCFKKGLNELEKIWEINDFAFKKSTKKTEKSIWFWTKYCSFEDIDKDGKIEPVIVYGTSGINGISDGRIKIIVVYKDIKYVIRHQNGVLDFERRTEIDQAFYSLPKQLIVFVKELLKRIVNDKNAIISNGWENAMELNKTILQASQNK